MDDVVLPLEPQDVKENQAIAMRGAQSWYVGCLCSRHLMQVEQA